MINEALSSLRRIVEKIMVKVDFCQTFPGVVVSQSSDLQSVDVKPDLDRIPELQGVPIRWGNPGVVCELGEGSRVMISFENASPAKPYVSMWQANSVQKLLLGDGTDFVALSTQLKAWMTTVSSHTHAYNDTGATPTAAITQPPLGLTPPNIASNKVKA